MSACDAVWRSHVQPAFNVSRALLEAAGPALVMVSLQDMQPQHHDEFSHHTKCQTSRILTTGRADSQAAQVRCLQEGEKEKGGMGRWAQGGVSSMAHLQAFLDLVRGVRLQRAPAPLQQWGLLHLQSRCQIWSASSL